MVERDHTNEIKKIFRKGISRNLKRIFLFLKTGNE